MNKMTSKEDIELASKKIQEQFPDDLILFAWIVDFRQRPSEELEKMMDRLIEQLRAITDKARAEWKEK